MDSLRKSLFLWLLCSLYSSWLQAQPSFNEGQITYQADTLRRLEKHPAASWPTQLIVYKKGQNIRMEVWQVNTANPMLNTKSIHLRNQQGPYTWIESADSLRDIHNFALFVSYTEESQLQQKYGPSPLNSGDQVVKVLQRIQWLGMPAERVALTSGANKEPAEAIVTKAITLPLGAIFPSVLALPDTPLQFIELDQGWRTQYTAKYMRKVPVSDSLFVVNPQLKVISMKELNHMFSTFD